MSALLSFFALTSKAGLSNDTADFNQLLKNKGINKPRFVRGDNFYNNLSFKRIKGKWKVKH